MAAVLGYAFLVGLCFGSFANVAVYRLPRGESVVTPPSRCPACGHRLALMDLIPIISWLALRRRCRYCRVTVSARYPLVELTAAVLFCAMTALSGPSLSAVALCALAFVLLCVSVIDWNTQEIPDGLSVFGAAVGVAWVGCAHFFPGLFPNTPGWSEALFGVAAGALPLFAIDRAVLLLAHKDGFGYGDMKLMAMAGIFLGWRLTLAAYFFAFIAGGVYAAFLLLTGRASRGTYIAFGPFLAAGTLTALWQGESFISAVFL